MTEIDELYQELHKSEGYNIFLFQRHLEVIEEIVGKNYSELTSHIRNYEKYVDKLPMGKTFSSRKAKGIRTNFLKLLMSYTSSIYALENNIEHFFGKAEQDLENARIMEKQSQFKLSPERLFIFGIRNYIEHSRILDVSNVISYSREGGIFIRRGEFNIKKSLITRDLISEHSLFLKYERDRLILLPYIKGNYKEFTIDIKDVLVKSQNKVEVLWKDINAILTEDYGEILAESKKIHKKMIRLQYKMFNKK